MRTIFNGYFRPKDDELSALWQNSLFVVDANVLLNLYRYSSTTKSELEKALNNIQKNIYIPHQAAKEFLKNRLNVTAGQATEYTKAISSINSLVSNLSSKDRHPFLENEELPEFEKYSKSLIEKLEKQQKALFDKFSNDEILAFVEDLFNGKTGKAYTEELLEKIVLEGEDRYEKMVPPGYKDSKKDTTDDKYRKFGDLIVWKQTIDHAKEKSKSVIFITDDKKEDWWSLQSGRTIGPRPELIEEFCLETEQKFWMYSVDKFIQESAKIAKTTISDDVIQEIIKVSSEAHDSEEENDAQSITTTQKTEVQNDEMNSGKFIITLNKSMKYATGTGRFTPKMESLPDFQVELVSAPIDEYENMKITYGCGTTINFNIHLKAKEGLLQEGSYTFQYKATLPVLTELVP